MNEQDYRPLQKIYNLFFYIFQSDDSYGIKKGHSGLL